MNAREEGFLLLSSFLGNPERKPLTIAQLHTLAARAKAMERPTEDRELCMEDLIAMGYGSDMAQKILELLEDLPVLRHYHAKGWRSDCYPVTRVSKGYPVVLRKRLGLDAPGVLWAKGDVTILQKPMISLVGSRDIDVPNANFASAVGHEAARQGYVLVSGNARGADRIAQKACLQAGGQIISVVADELEKWQENPNILYLSEDGYDCAFSAQRALSRNRVIHALGDKVFVAQCGLGKGGTWSGTVRNLKGNWSPVFVFRDGSGAAMQLEQLGASGITQESLRDFAKLPAQNLYLFD